MSAIIGFLFNNEEFGNLEHDPNRSILWALSLLPINQQQNYSIMFRNDYDNDLQVEATYLIEEILRRMHHQHEQLMTTNQVHQANNLTPVIQNFHLQFYLEPTSFYCYVRDFINFEREILGLPFNEDLPLLEMDKINAIMERMIFWVQFNEKIVENPQSIEVLEFQKKMLFFTDMKEIFSLKVVSCVNRWKNDQKTNSRKETVFRGEEGLVEIQRIMENLIYILNTTKMQMSQLVSIGFIQFQDLAIQNANVLRKLINESVVIEVQPPQVLRKKIIFLIQLRLLIAPRMLNIRVNGTPKVALANEFQVTNIHKINCVPSEFCASGVIENGIGQVIIHEKYLSINFENMHLISFQRANKKAAEVVTEEKFAFLFQIEIAIDNELIKIWKFSLPIVPIVHGNQELNAWATIFWDNFFGSKSRLGFEVPETVPWSNLAEALNIFFSTKMERPQDRITGGKSLNQENLNCLAEKLQVTSNDLQVDWSTFSRKELPNRNFSFWKWFYEVLKLLSLEDNLKDAWQNNRIVGFMMRELADNYLTGCQTGTFLLRFSDSTLGGLSIAACSGHLNPFTTKDFRAHSLNQRISNFTDLTHLFPNIPKAEAFPIDSNVKRPPGYVNAEQRFGR